MGWDYAATRGYTRPVLSLVADTAAFFAFSVMYSGCWLVVDCYPKKNDSQFYFMIRIGEKLSWVDPLIGSMPQKDLALRNVCSFSLGLLNLTYVHTSGTTVNILILFLIAF